MWKRMFSALEGILEFVIATRDTRMLSMLNSPTRGEGSLVTIHKGKDLVFMHKHLVVNESLSSLINNGS